MNTRDLLTGVGVGAVLAFMLDPNGGARRRARVRDKMAKASRIARENLGKTARDLGNRTRGVTAAARGRFAAGNVSDEVLIERVRARLGRACSHPRAIDVFARDGQVMLRGPILATEVGPLVETVKGVRGVKEVVNELEPHETGERLSSLQGEGRVPGPGFDLLQRRWAPGTRALVAVGVIGAGILAAAASRA